MRTEAYADVVSTTILMDRPFHRAIGGFSLEDAFDVQDAVGERLLAPRGGLAGYKIAWNAEHLMEAFGMPHPGMGRVFSGQVQHGGGEVELSDFRGLCIEAEIVAILGGDLGPGQFWTAETVAPMVESFTVGFEVLDRLNAPQDATGPEILAHNVFNAGAVIGEIRAPALDVDFSAITTRVFDGQKVVAEGANLAPQNPFEAIAFLADHFCGRGYTLRAGDIVLCGSHIPLYLVEAPTRLGISMGVLGEVWLKVSGSE